MYHLAYSNIQHKYCLKLLLIFSHPGLSEAFLGLIGVGEQQQTMEETATRIALAFKANSTSWVLSTAAALYWRVKGI